MLNARNRMRRPTEFEAVIRRGRRARSGTLVVHHLPGLPGSGPEEAPRIGLIVGKNVGSSVVRHRVSRQLRAQLALRLDRFPTASGTVIRALPGADTAGSAALGADLDRSLARIPVGAAR